MTDTWYLIFYHPLRGFSEIWEASQWHVCENAGTLVWLSFPPPSILFNVEQPIALMTFAPNNMCLCKGAIVRARWLCVIAPMWITYLWHLISYLSCSPGLIIYQLLIGSRWWIICNKRRLPVAFLSEPNALVKRPRHGGGQQAAAFQPSHVSKNSEYLISIRHWAWNKCWEFAKEKD